MCRVQKQARTKVRCKLSDSQDARAGRPIRSDDVSALLARIDALIG
jgi:hypothetical protein